MKTLLCGLLLAFAALAADPAPSVARKVTDNNLTMVERELVPLAEAMPAEKFEFVPAGDTFKTVRTFQQQIAHIAGVIYVCSAAVLGEKPPAEAGEGENGPAGLKSKEDTINYLKGAIAYGHKALATLTDTNAYEMVQSPFGTNKVPRLYVANVLAWHSMDHYGQLVIYARMNGIVPPASR